VRGCLRAHFLAKRQLVITIASSQSNTTNQARKPFLLTIYSPKASEIQFHESSSISPHHIASRERQQQHQQKKERTCRRQKSGEVKSKMEGFTFWKPNLLYEFKKQLWF
jgi:hypothetical protein